MRIDIAFDAEGTTLRGWLYLPEKGKEPFPLVVMTHGWAAVEDGAMRSRFDRSNSTPSTSLGHTLSALLQPHSCSFQQQKIR